jgi:hypothetical protein
MPTDKKILMKGLKYMGWALPLFFIGPVVIFNAFQNKSNPFFIPVLGVAITLCILAVFFMARGLKTILKSMTD